MEIIVKDLPKISTNTIYAGVHWTARKKHKEAFLWLTAHFKRLEKITGKVDIDFHFFFAKNPLDSSNVSYAVKLLEDSLVTYGVIEGDSPKFVRKISMQSQKGESDYCIINITKLNNH